ncbi:MAG TPA: CRISPR-associated endonuclease Cas2 [Candidatus Paceibacterota bacterium]
MGKLEKEAVQVRRRGYLRDAVLTAVGGAGLLLVAMAAPNVLQLLGKTPIGKRFKDQTRSTLSRLAKDGLIRFEERGGKKFARLTDKGRDALAFEQQKRMLQEGRKKRWDRRYRIVSFDIAEKKRAVRIRLRTIMQSTGFIRLQDSVWVYPYDCEDFIALLKADLEIGKEVVYIIAETIENDQWLRDHFSLPRK